MGCVLFGLFVVLCPTQQLGLCRDGQLTLPLYFLGTNTRLDIFKRDFANLSFKHAKNIFPSVAFLYSLSILGPDL